MLTTTRQKHNMNIAPWTQHGTQNKQLCKTRGMEWQCASCDLLFPSEAFIDDDRRYNKDKGAIKILARKEYCLNKGHWRRCRACLDIRYDNDFSISSSITKQCQRCKYNRPAEYFRESATTCNACLFKQQYEVFSCAQCHKITSLKDWCGRHNECHHR